MLSAIRSLDGFTPGGLERVEVGALLGRHDQGVRLHRPAAAALVAARRPARARVRSRTSACRWSPSCRRRGNIRSAGPRRKPPIATLPADNGGSQAAVRRTACCTPPRYRLLRRAPVSEVTACLLDGGDQFAGHRGQLATPASPSRGCRSSGSRSARCGRRPSGSADRTPGCVPWAMIAVADHRGGIAARRRRTG